MRTATARATVLEGFAELVRSAGADPVQLVRAARIPRAVLTDLDARIPLELGKVDKAVLNNGEVLRSGHRPHPGKRLRFACVDGADVRVGMRTTQNLTMQHPRQLKVGTVPRGAGNLVQCVVTVGPSAQHVVFNLNSG